VLEQYARRAIENFNVALGSYVIMPDHVHLFVRGGRDFTLSSWIGGLKRAISVTLEPPKLRQPGFFDHILRSMFKRPWTSGNFSGLAMTLCYDQRQFRRVLRPIFRGKSADDEDRNRDLFEKRHTWLVSCGMRCGRYRRLKVFPVSGAPCKFVSTIVMSPKVAKTSQTNDR
jgi:hypothetical protein